MSVSSSDFPILSYATSALNAQVSGATGTAFTKVVPAGKYLVTGAIDANSVGADKLLSVSLRTSSGTPVEYAELILDVAGGLTSYKAPFSVFHESDGSNAFVASVSCTVSASGTWGSSAGIPVKFKLL
nr:MAG: hypothetical protein [Lake Baikal virophage 8]